MKIRNKEVKIKIGEKEHTFTNLITNAYLDLFANSHIDFVNKNLVYCFVNFTKNNIGINENSTKMEYDTILEIQPDDNQEVLTNSTIINKYFYKSPLAEYPYLENFKNKPIRQIGFGNYDYELQDYVLYAYLDISRYNIIIQDNQPVIISRIDEIKSDMDLWSNNKEIKAPYHLTTRGKLDYQGLDIVRTIPKLTSMGFGILPYVFKEEFLIENISIKKGGTGELIIQNNFYNYKKNDLYPSETLYPKEPTANLLMFKYKMYKETFPNPEKPAVYVDTGDYYIQYREFKDDEYGKFNLKIKYERS